MAFAGSSCPSPILTGWGEIGSFLRCDERTARRLLGEGLPVTKIGKAYRSTPSLMEHWLADRARRAAGG